MKTLYKSVFEHYNGDNVINFEMRQALATGFQSLDYDKNINIMAKAMNARSFKTFEQCVRKLSEEV